MGADDAGDLVQQVVADLVSMFVIDPLEVVQVGDHGRQAPAIALHAVDLGA